MFSQTAALNGFCEQGSFQVITSGLPSSNVFQNLIPQCNVSVYLTGSTNLATIYADINNTPLTNPFTATTKAQWLFFAAIGQGYDVVMSGGTPPYVYSVPVTLTDLLVGGGGGGGGCTSSGIPGTFQASNGSGGCQPAFVQVNGTNLLTPSPVNFLNNTVVGFSNPSAGVIQASLEPTGVTAGTYTCVTAQFNAAGQATSAANGTCSGGGGTEIKWAVLSWLGLQTTNNQTFASIFIAPQTGTVPSGCSGSSGGTFPTTYSGGAVTYPTATGSTAFTIWDLTTTTALCTITFSASGSTGVPSGAGGSISSGDQVVVTGAASPDATLQNFNVTLAVTVTGGGGGGGGGTVTSVGLVLPGIFSVTGSPVTISGNLTATLASQNANLVFAGPASGGSATPTFRSLVAADIPTIPLSNLATQAANTVVGNGTAGTASPTALALPSCSASTNALTWASSTGFGCNNFTSAIGYPGAGIANSTGTSWGTSYSTTNLIPANVVSILNQNTTGNAATATALQAAPSGCSAGTALTQISSTGNPVPTTGCAAIGGSPLWSSLLSPTANVTLTMIGYTTFLNYGAATGSSDLFRKTDSTGNTGTGIMDHDTTASGSSEIPWQADANGVGWQVGINGALQGIGGSAHGITIPAGTAVSGVANKVVFASDATNGYGEINENNAGLSRICTAANASSVSGCQPATSTGNYVNLCSVVSLTNATCTSGKISYVGVASVTISSIPGTYLTLELRNKGYSSPGNAVMVFSLNGDTTSGHYVCQIASSSGTSLTSDSCTSLGTPITTGFSGGFFGSSSTEQGASDFTMPFYADSVVKSGTGTFFEGGDPDGGTVGGRWNQTAAVTSITITPSGGGTITGSLALYGTN